MLGRRTISSLLLVIMLLLFAAKAVAGVITSEIIGYLPSGRYSAPLVSASDGYLYMFGGNTASGLTDEIVRIDPLTGQAKVVARLPVRMYRPAAEEGPDGAIYVVGGYTGQGERTIYRFDPRTRTVTLAGYLATTGGLSGAAVVRASNGRLYVFGGNETRPEISYAYDEIQEIAVDGSGRATTRVVGYLPRPLTGIAGALGPDGKIYLFGGQYQCPASLSDCTGKPAGFYPWNRIMRFDPSTRQIQVIGQMDRDLAYSAASMGLDERIYLFGGLVRVQYDNNGKLILSQNTSEVMRYNPNTGRWETVGEVDIDPPRNAASSTTDRMGYMYVAAGRNGSTYYADIRRITLHTDLAIQQITTRPSPVADGDPLTVEVWITNLGLVSPERSFAVEIREGTTVLARRVLADLPPGAVQNISFSITLSGAAWRTLSAFVDPDNLVREATKANNQRTVSIYVQPTWVHCLPIPNPVRMESRGTAMLYCDPQVENATLTGIVGIMPDGKRVPFSPLSGGLWRAAYTTTLIPGSYMATYEVSGRSPAGRLLQALVPVTLVVGATTAPAPPAGVEIGGPMPGVPSRVRLIE